MNEIQFTILPPAGGLERDIEYFRISQYSGEEGLPIKVCPNGLPGLLFQHAAGRSAIRNIVTSSGRTVDTIPTLFLYGHIMELSQMNFMEGPFLNIQVVFKPHALSALFVEDASVLTNNSMDYSQFGADSLNRQLLETTDVHQGVSILSDYLSSRQAQAVRRDELIEESLRYIHDNIHSVGVSELVGYFHLSERQFQKRFLKIVGVTPQYYIRLRRFNAAVRLMDSGKYDRLGDIAHALNYHDQSHFIRDIKEFSGITPKSITQKTNQFHHDMVGSSYLA